MGCLHIVTIAYLLLLPLTNINGDKNFIAGMDKFAVQLYSAISDKHPGINIVLSPLSIQMCATMALMGANGETATELRRGLGFGSLDNDVLTDMYNTFLKKYENRNIMKISNKIYVTSGLKGLKPFVDTVKNKFNSEASNLDFMAGEEALISINDWIESKTNHFIKDFIPFGAIQRTARIILLNVVHFKANWNAKHENYNCGHIDTNCRLYNFPVDSLQGTPWGPAGMVPYRDPNIQQLFVLRIKNASMRQLDDYIKTTTINNIIKQLNEKAYGWNVEKCNTTVDMGLVDVFQKLGMNRIFNKKDADFGAMLNVTESLKISGIIHKTKLNFNTEGTEAVAATAIQFNVRCSGKYDSKNQFCPISAMYAYVHKTEDGDFIPIFMGRGVKTF